MKGKDGERDDATGRSGRWRRRERRQAAERNRLQKHGAGLRTAYRDAILKRLRKKTDKKSNTV